MKVEDSRVRPVGMWGLFGGGRWPLIENAFDDLVGQAAGGEDVFRSRLEETNDAFVVGDDEEREVSYSELRKDVVGDNEGRGVEQEIGWSFGLDLGLVGGDGRRRG